ncbi:RNA-binding cell elongation regulator Jag/EloR [Anaerobacillus sp. MEB173]|uniref:RNA-binding cell elongation regulator Jag/EloR n=1 Tax=Anaerobacillus sp. MEB173 TaxID=3383345 RepID=UPI003F8E5DBB
MKKVTVSGKTVDEAVETALAQLNTTKDRVQLTVIEEPQKGFLGLIGSKPALVEVLLKPDPVEESLAFLNDIISKMDIEVEIKQSTNRDGHVFELTGEKIGVLIGKRGQTLDSLQYLVNLVANKHSEGYIRITLDAENYRARRKEALEQLATRIGQKAIKTRKEVILEPMNALERKIIHVTLQDMKGIKTYSEGVEPNRRIVVAPK